MQGAGQELMLDEGDVQIIACTVKSAQACRGSLPGAASSDQPARGSCRRPRPDQRHPAPVYK